MFWKSKKKTIPHVRITKRGNNEGSPSYDLNLTTRDKDILSGTDFKAELEWIRSSTPPRGALDDLLNIGMILIPITLIQIKYVNKVVHFYFDGSAYYHKDTTNVLSLEWKMSFKEFDKLATEHPLRKLGTHHQIKLTFTNPQSEPDIDHWKDFNKLFADFDKVMGKCFGDQRRRLNRKIRDV